MRPQADAPLQSLNTLALEARARALVSVADENELREALAWAHARGLPVVPLGEGSNIILAGDMDSLVVHQSGRGVQLLRVEGEEVLIRAAAGQDWHALVEWTLGEGLYGLENLALIPGTVGAAPIQNIGAYGVELESFVEAVHAISIHGGESITLGRADCEFGYRDSVFKGRLRDQLVITAVEFRLSRQQHVRADYPALAEALANTQAHEISAEHIFHAVVQIRRSKLPDPARLPNAGSFFKNPVVGQLCARELQLKYPGLPVYPLAGGKAKLAAAWMIDFCGWKGHRAAGVGVHPEHALVLANYGANNGGVLLALAREIADSVEKCFGIALEIEPRVYGRAG